MSTTRRSNIVGTCMMFAIGSLLAFPSLTQATVYSWRDEKGTLQLSNNVEEVPGAQRAAAHQFVSKLAAVTPVSSETPLPRNAETTPANAEMHAYERGLAQGLQTAEQQISLAGELAQAILAATPRPAPPRIILHQAGPVIVRDVSPAYSFPSLYSYARFSGAPDRDFPRGPYCGTSKRFSSTQSLRCRRFVPHSHFFPGRRRTNAELYFPQGHVSHRGYLFGHSFAVR